MSVNLHGNHDDRNHAVTQAAVNVAGRQKTLFGKKRMFSGRVTVKTAVI